MIKISKKSQYGLRAMVYLAKNNKRIVPLSEISDKESIPFDFLEKILSVMEKSGLIKSKKGVQGGYSLAGPASKTSALQILSALEGSELSVNCAVCSKEKKCSSKNVWYKLNSSLQSTLSSIKLSKLI